MHNCCTMYVVQNDTNWVIRLSIFEYIIFHGSFHRVFLFLFVQNKIIKCFSNRMKIHGLLQVLEVSHQDSKYTNGTISTSKSISHRFREFVDSLCLSIVVIVYLRKAEEIETKMCNRTIRSQI